MQMVMKSASKRILVMRYRFIGDTILTVPFLRNLRRAEPDAYIAWMVAPGSADVVAGIPYVDRMIFWDPVTIHADSRGTHRTFSSKLRFIKELRAYRFDKVYVLKRSFSSALMAWVSGASERVGFDTEFRGCLLTKRVPYRHDRHEVENFLDVLRSDGVKIEDAHLEIWTTAEEDANALRLIREIGLSAGDRIVVIHPFSAVIERGWPMENFAALANRLLSETDLHPVIVGADKDRESFMAARRLFDVGVRELIGRCTLRETISLLKRSALFIGNDSGIMHLAAAAGIPVVALFGPQTPIKFGPWSKRATVIYKKMPCSPCRQKFFEECSPSPRLKPICMESITVEDVFRAAAAASHM